MKNHLVVAIAALTLAASCSPSIRDLCRASDAVKPVVLDKINAGIKGAQIASLTCK